MSEVVAHTVVALVVMIGGFVLMIISMVTGHPIPDNTMTLLIVLMSSAAGWFFGTHSTLSGMYAQQSNPAAPLPDLLPPIPTQPGTPAR